MVIQEVVEVVLVLIENKLLYMETENFIILNEIKDILKKFTDEKTLNKIHLKTSIGTDIGLQGDDAFQFILEFSNYFKIDLNHFYFNDYFINEGVDLFGIIKYLRYGRKTMKELLIEHLILAVKTKQLS